MGEPQVLLALTPSFSYLLPMPLKLIGEAAAEAQHQTMEAPDAISILAPLVQMY